MGNPRGGFSKGFKGGNYKQYRPSYPYGKGKQPRVGQDRPAAGSVGDITIGYVIYSAMGVENWTTK